MIKHTDEILLPVLDTDASAVPRYNVIGADGQTIYENVALRLVNGVAQEGTPVNKPLLDEFLAASGVTAGSATAYTLAQEDFSLFNGAPVRFQLHVASGGNATLNINNTGAKPMRDTLGQAMQGGIPAGTWLTATYSAPTGAYIFAAGSGGGSNPNLLDNWYLADPVNQRGQTEYTGEMYTIDRWKLGSIGAIFIESNGILLDNSSGISQLSYVQYISEPPDSGLMTFSVLTPNGVFSVSSDSSSTNQKTTDFGSIRTGYSTGMRVQFGQIYVTAGFSVKIIAVKLELGDKQTLAHQDENGNWILNDPPPDKGMELLKCIQSTADASDTYANKVIATTESVDALTAADVGAVQKQVFSFNQSGVRLVDYINDLIINKNYSSGVIQVFGVTPPDCEWLGAYGLVTYQGHLDNYVEVRACIDGSLKMRWNKFIRTYGETAPKWLYEWQEFATTDYVDSAGGSAKILSNTRITADSTSLSISLPTDYTHFRIVMTEVATTDSSNGNVRGSFDVDSANMSNSGMQIAGNSSGTATATAVSMSNAAFLVTLADADTFGSIVIDIVRYSGITQGTCRWATDGGGNNANVNMGTTNFSAVGTPTSLTVTAMGGFALRSGMAIMVMGVK